MRPIMFVLSGKMAAAHFRAGIPAARPLAAPQGGEAALLFLVVFLFLVAHGGTWSLDELVHR